MRGLLPANLRHRQGLGPATRFLGMQSKQASPIETPLTGLLPAPFKIKDSARNPALPDLTGRRITMDERLCRSARRFGPNDRCGTVARRHRRARR
jgi:hypothetical protein